MEQTNVQKLAKVLNVLVTITFAANILAIILIPGLLAHDPYNLIGGARDFLDSVVYAGEDDIVFAEVKTRTCDAFDTPAAAVDRRKQRRYADIARYFLSCVQTECAVRFDVLEVTKEGVEWLKNAFEC